DESVEALSLSKENEVEEVDPQQPEIQLGESDEEEYTSDQNESDNEDANTEFDISPTSEDEMENDPRPLHLHHRQQDLLYDMFMRNHRFTEHSYELHARSVWTTTTRGDIIMLELRLTYDLSIYHTYSPRWFFQCRPDHDSGSV
ncbi:hypothetical protein Taro_016492, partial [Colocasia esculenta]|nr:hypothetical protein [Colocasia esculenta]